MFCHAFRAACIAHATSPPDSSDLRPPATPSYLPNPVASHLCRTHAWPLGRPPPVPPALHPTKLIGTGAAASMQAQSSGKTATAAGCNPRLLLLRGQQPRRQHARHLTRCEVAKPGGGAREDELAQSSAAAPAADAPNGAPCNSAWGLVDVLGVSSTPALLPATPPLPPACTCRRRRSLLPVVAAPAAAVLEFPAPGGSGAAAVLQQVDGNPIKTSGLHRTPLSGGVQNATLRCDLPSPAVAGGWGVDLCMCCVRVPAVDEWQRRLHEGQLVAVRLHAAASQASPSSLLIVPPPTVPFLPCHASHRTLPHPQFATWLSKPSLRTCAPSCATCTTAVPASPLARWSTLRQTGRGTPSSGKDCCAGAGRLGAGRRSCLLIPRFKGS